MNSFNSTFMPVESDEEGWRERGVPLNGLLHQRDHLLLLLHLPFLCTTMNLAALLLHLLQFVVAIIQIYQ